MHVDLPWIIVRMFGQFNCNALSCVFLGCIEL